MHLNQTELFQAISMEVVRQAKNSGNPKLGVIPRQMNAIISAANMVVEAFKIEEIKATPGMGIAAWRQTDDAGLSSKFMASILFPQHGVGVEYNYPHDHDDFGRCLKMLRAARPSDWRGNPEARYALLAETGEEWCWLVDKWEHLCTVYESDQTGAALYAELKTLRTF